MTPSEIELVARRRYNAVNDTFWSQQEIFDYIYGACLEASDKAFAVERTYSTTTVADTQEYDYPSNAIAVKRATWNGRKLTRIDMIEDDVLTGMNQGTDDRGNPQYYWIWNNTISLRPIPSSAEALKLWTFNEPSPIISATGVLEIPSLHHMRLVTYVLACMAEKDQNFTAADRHWAKWEKEVGEIRKSMVRVKRTDKFTTVKDETMVVETRIGG